MLVGLPAVIQDKLQKCIYSLEKLKHWHFNIETSAVELGQTKFGRLRSCEKLISHQLNIVSSGGEGRAPSHGEPKQWGCGRDEEPWSGVGQGIRWTHSQARLS